MKIKFAITCCASPPTAPPPSARLWKSATTTGRCRRVRTPGPSIGRDSRGWLHVVWFTLGRSETEAGIYYSVSKDDGKSFAPRQLIHANTAPEILYANLILGADDTVYLAWSNLDKANRAQIFMRTISPDGGTWSAIQQVSNVKGNAGRPVLALRNNQLHIAWTETDSEDSRVVMRNAAVSR